MADPASVTARSIMPPFPWLLTDDLDWARVQANVDAMAMLGVPYGENVLNGKAIEDAKAQAEVIAKSVKEQGGPDGLAGKKITALVAYLQRLGTDISVKAPEAAPKTASAK